MDIQIIILHLRLLCFAISKTECACLSRQSLNLLLSCTSKFDLFHLSHGGSTCKCGTFEFSKICSEFPEAAIPRFRIRSGSLFHVILGKGVITCSKFHSTHLSIWIGAPTASTSRRGKVGRSHLGRASVALDLVVVTLPSIS
jgi:hypothetical protein